MQKQLLLTCQGVNLFLCVDQLLDCTKYNMVEGTSIAEIVADNPEDCSVETFKVLVTYENTLDLVQKCVSFSGVIHEHNAIEYDESEGSFEVISIDVPNEKMEDLEEPIITFTDDSQVHP